MFRKQNRTSNRDGRSQIVIRLDRLQFRARAFFIKALLFAGFTRIRGHFVRSQTAITTYMRVETFINRMTGTKLFLQCQPACPWLWPYKVTAIPDDQLGFCRLELERVFSAFKNA